MHMIKAARVLYCTVWHVNGSQPCLTLTPGCLLLTLTDVDEEMLCSHTNSCLPSCAPYEIWDVLWLHGISHKVNKLIQMDILTNMSSDSINLLISHDVTDPHP